MAGKPRVLVLHNGHLDASLSPVPVDAETVHAETLSRALTLLQHERFDGVYTDTRGLTLIDQAGLFLRADKILEMLADAVVIVDTDLRVLWSNPAFERWCRGPIKDKTFYAALGSPEILGPDYSPFHSALSHGPITTCLHTPDGRFAQFHVTPIRSGDNKVAYYIAVGRDVSAERQQQQKLDAIHRAGAELASLDPKELADLKPEERIELLKSNIRRYSHDLLHYDVVEIRMLDSVTGRLEPLLTEGITPEAARRILFPLPKNNGVTGFVAATGKSYLCPDTTTDPLYLEGAAGARSSLTVPLIDQDKVIGTFNVESPQPGHFTEQDQQFLEIFGREIANSLHTLDLLVAEKRSTATQSVEAISREVAIPVDEILTSACALLDRYIGHDPDMAERLQTILQGARAIKESIQKVGETMAPSASVDQTRDSRGQGLRGMRILVADNDERLRRSAHSLLGRFGCVVETARDGKEALVMARTSAYDAVLADIRLPDMNGYEVFHTLKLTQPDLPVVLMSAYGYDSTHSIVKARQEGLRTVLYKPFRIDQLVDALDKVSQPALANLSQVPAGAVS